MLQGKAIHRFLPRTGYEEGTLSNGSPFEATCCLPPSFEVFLPAVCQAETARRSAAAPASLDAPEESGDEEQDDEDSLAEPSDDEIEQLLAVIHEESLHLGSDEETGEDGVVSRRTSAGRGQTGSSAPSLPETRRTSVQGFIFSVFSPFFWRAASRGTLPQQCLVRIERPRGAGIRTPCDGLHH